MIVTATHANGEHSMRNIFDIDALNWKRSVVMRMRMQAIFSVALVRKIAIIFLAMIIAYFATSFSMGMQHAQGAVKRTTIKEYGALARQIGDYKEIFAIFDKDDNDTDIQEAVNKLDNAFEKGNSKELASAKKEIIKIQKDIGAKL